MTCIINGGYSRNTVVVAVVFACTTLGLYLDADATRFGQYLLGLCAWTILFALVYGESSHIRLQVAVAILAATACEFTFAPTYHIYIYRFDNVPAYVPPGHGMVYLTAVALGRSEVFIRFQRLITWLVFSGGGAWALWGILGAERLDHGGAALFVVFIGFVLMGRSPRVYLGAYFITTFLELWGTHWGTWAWAEYWPSWGNLPQANPPSGIAAGYCFLDAVALTVAPCLGRAVSVLASVQRQPDHTQVDGN